jgi:hypothetical protein
MRIRYPRELPVHKAPLSLTPPWRSQPIFLSPYRRFDISPSTITLYNDQIRYVLERSSVGGPTRELPGPSPVGGPFFVRFSTPNLYDSRQASGPARLCARNVMAVTDAPAGSGSLAGNDAWEVSMKRKLLLAVVWIALAGGIAAVIIFPPDSVLTSISPLIFFVRGRCGATAAAAWRCSARSNALQLTIHYGSDARIPSRLCFDASH